MNWFEEWFDSPLYEKLYANRDEYEARQLAELIEKIIPRDEYPNILDLGCGRGRHSITLAEVGYKVTGVDLSQDAITKAKKKAKARNLSNVIFAIGDMRAPLPAQYDAIVNLFTTFGYFEKDDENRKVLQNVAGMLRREGVFIMDFMNAGIVKKNFIPEESGEFQNLKYEIRRFIKDDMIYKKIAFTGDQVGPGETEYTERVKLYDRNWFKTELKKARLNLKACYGNYNGEPFLPESPRLIMVSENVSGYV